MAIPEKNTSGNHGKVPKRYILTIDTELPIEGSVELDMSVERLWQIFSNVPNWPRWNACFWWARVWGGELKVDTLLYWCFNPIRPLYLVGWGADEVPQSAALFRPPSPKPIVQLSLQWAFQHHRLRETDIGFRLIGLP
jgi:hypothetical protein